jgi:hypothetical protein
MKTLALSSLGQWVAKPEDGGSFLESLVGPIQAKFPCNSRRVSYKKSIDSLAAPFGSG